MRAKQLGLVALLAAGVLVAANQIMDAQRELVATETCSLASDGRHRDALAEISRAELNDHSTSVIECRCFAYLAMGESGSCVEEVLAFVDVNPDARFETEVASVVTGALQAQGDVAGAMKFTSMMIPIEGTVSLEAARIYIEAVALSDPERVPARAQDIANRLPHQAASEAFHLHAVEVLASSGHYASALAFSAHQAASVDDETHLKLHFVRLLCMAYLRDTNAMVAEMTAAESHGVAHVDAQLLAALACNHALLGTVGICDAATSSSLLRAYIDERAGVRRNADVYAMSLFSRLITSLTASSEHETAAALHATAIRVFPDIDRLTGTRNLESLRAAASGNDETGSITFHFAPNTIGEIRITSPNNVRHHPPLTHIVASNSTSGSSATTVAHRTQSFPTYVQALDVEKRVVDRRVLWPRTADAVHLTIPETKNTAPLPPMLDDVVTAFQPSTDGVRRVVLVLLDSGDWRLWRATQVLSGTPFLDHVDKHGVVGRLLAKPPQTSASIATLTATSATAQNTASALVTFGGQLAQVLSGTNPFASLKPFTTHRSSLFETLASHDVTSANLLMRKGAIDPGEVDHIFSKGRPPTPMATRPHVRVLRHDELKSIGVAELDHTVSLHFADAAAAFDAADDMAGRRDIRFSFVHIDGTDSLAHLRGDDIRNVAMWDRSPLFQLYAYVDRRLSALAARLDSDDVLVVISDHGTENQVTHDEEALFIALSPSIQPARFDDVIPLAAVPTLIGRLLGVEIPGSRVLSPWVVDKDAATTAPTP